MKKLFCLFIIIHCCTLAFAGKDSVYVQIINDTVKVWNVGVEENCCVAFIHEITIVNDSITVIEKDTSTSYCRCMCNFDLCATLIGISQGLYRVLIYRKYKIFDHGHTPDSLYFIDSTSFTYGGSGSMFAAKSYQSACYDPTVKVKDEQNNVPTNTKLEQNYPNPFNPTTTIRYQLPVNSLVTIKVFNILGQEVATLVDEVKQAGVYSVQFNARNLPSGIYTYKLNAGSFIDVKKFILIK